MSTEEQSTEQNRNFEESIEEIYQQYRHRQLASRLEDIAETMQETILQRILAEKFLKEELVIEDDAKRSVSNARDLLQAGDFESLGDRIDELERTVENQKRRVSNEIHEARIAMRSRVDGMQRLNERVERVSDVKLQAVHELLSDWDWKGQVYKDQNWDFETLEERAAEYGEDMRRYFEECREDIFGPYEGTSLESIVDGLLSDEQLYFDRLSDDQVEQLRDSDLVTNIEIRLS